MATAAAEGPAMPATVPMRAPALVACAGAARLGMLLAVPFPLYVALDLIAAAWLGPRLLRGPAARIGVAATAPAWVLLAAVAQGSPSPATHAAALAAALWWGGVVLATVGFPGNAPRTATTVVSWLILTWLADETMTASPTLSHQSVSPVHAGLQEASLNLYLHASAAVPLLVSGGLLLFSRVVHKQRRHRLERDATSSSS